MIALRYDLGLVFIVFKKRLIIKDYSFQNQDPSEINNDGIDFLKLKNINYFTLYNEIKNILANEIFLDIKIKNFNILYFSLSFEYNNYFCSKGLYKISLVDYNNFINQYCVNEDAKNWISEGF
jgi:hypothetical protein